MLLPFRAAPPPAPPPPASAPLVAAPPPPVPPVAVPPVAAPPASALADITNRVDPLDMICGAACCDRGTAADALKAKGDVQSAVLFLTKKNTMAFDTKDKATKRRRT